MWAGTKSVHGNSAKLIPSGSFLCLRIRRDSHRQSIQDQCGGSHLRLEFESMSHLTGALWVEP